MSSSPKYFNFSCSITEATYPFYGNYVKVMLSAVIVNIIFCPAIVCLNTLVVMAIWRKKKLRTPSNLLLANTAISDIMVGFISIPLHFSNFFMNFDRRYDCNLYTLQITSIHLFSLVSFIMVMIVTIDRVIAIFKPFFYHEKIASHWKSYCYLIALVWISLTGLLVILVIVPAWYVLLYLEAAIFFLTCFICFTAQAAIYSIVKRFRRVLPHGKSKRTNGQQGQQSSQKLIRKETKTTILTFLMLLSILICYLPYGVTASLWVFDYYPDWLTPLNLWSYTMIILKSLLNPLLYCYSNSSIYKQVRTIAKLSKRSTFSEITNVTKINPKPVDAS